MLWQIVPRGREGFGLDGDGLIDFVRRHILAFLESGAKPIGSPYMENAWVVLDCYGKTSSEIVEAIINEWIALGRDPNFGDVWFAMPCIYEKMRQSENGTAFL